eukprot:c23140_g1_i3 orf=1260-2801(-)
MTRQSVVSHPNSGHDGGSLLQAGKLASSESSASEKAEDTGERHGGYSHHLRSSSAHPGVLGGFLCAMDDSVLDYDSAYDYASTSSFEFQKGERASVKSLVGPYLNKAAPSKWDDAEKWLVNQSPGEAPAKGRTKSGPLHGHHVHGGIHVNKRGQQEWHVHAQSMKNEYDTLMASVLPNGESFELPGERTKKMDTLKGPSSGPNFAFIPLPVSPPKGSSLDCYSPTDEPVDMKEMSMTDEGSFEDSFLKPIMRTRKPTSDSLVSVVPYVSPAPAVRSVSMRDMGTEMTPIASQEPSRTGTPLCATTPMLHSPVSSPPSTPRQGSPTGNSPMRTSAKACVLDADGKQLKEMHAEMGREMQILGAHAGGKLTMVSWASKEEEDADASQLLKNIDLEEVKKNVLETRAVAWEEAEQSKYLARFKREEAKILAWENHEKAKAEAEMRRIEVKVEKRRSHAQESLMNKLAAARRKAEERLAAAEAKRCEQASKSAHRADYIRRTGRLPSSSFFSCGLCR